MPDVPSTPLSGTVVHGAGRGRGLGLPTANLAPDPGASVPAPAVYSGWLSRPAAGAVHRATISIGTNPTFCDTAEVHTEVHCHDTSDDLYGEHVDLWFVARIRDTVRFAGPDELIRAALEDIRRSEAVLDTPHARAVRAAALSAALR
ncbi:riboflavin kinase [Streptomyces sp. TLI_171]|uniref:riboflavin kinase n=1 Tax=Streptomyces sp. TLI_171 TaxID=1938859 RepID=UPI000C181828|nr:riboflavin kinase [Streptomyces sp. TLI_171]